MPGLTPEGSEEESAAPVGRLGRVAAALLLLFACAAPAEAGWLDFWRRPAPRVDSFILTPGVAIEIAPDTRLIYKGIANGQPARVLAVLDTGAKRDVAFPLTDEVEFQIADGTTCLIFVKAGNNLEGDIDVTCPAP